MLIAIAGTAIAGQVTYTVDTGLKLTNNMTGVSFPQFDPLLGTLQSVDFSLQGFADIFFGVSNTDASQNVQYALTAEVSLSLRDPTCAPSCLVSQQLAYVDASTLSPSNPNGPAGPQGSLAPGSSTGFQSVALSTLPTDLGAIPCGTYGAFCGFFTGSGTVMDIIDMTDLTTLTASGGTYSYGESASGQGLLTIIYNFDSSSEAGTIDPTPEPFSMALCGIGLLGFSIALRKRKKKR